METAQREQNVNLDLISVSETNKMFRSTNGAEKESLTELSESIAQVGVLQRILLRPDPANPDKFIIVFGERRFRASKLAGKNDIPATIRELSDDDAFELQMTENLQREDVHPLNEAKGYKYLLDKDQTITTAELSLRFGKSESYIVQRLKLNDLIADAKKDFLANKMSVGHALLLARLTPNDQKEAIRQLSDSRYGYRTIADLQSFINRNIINNLSNAPFNLDDPDLLKKAGPCSLCPKRSGNSPLLFSDIQENDRCVDRACFITKCNKYLIGKTREIIETSPEIVFLADRYRDPIQEVTELIQEHKIKVLYEYSDFSDSDKSGEKVKGFWLSGNRAGFMQSVYLRKKTEANGQSDDPKSVVMKIQQRLKRGVELDQEKVYAKILEAMKVHPTQKKSCNKKLQSEEEVFLWFMVFDKAGFTAKEELKKVLGISSQTPEKLYQSLKNLKPEKKALLLRRVMLDQYGGLYPRSEYGFIIRKIAESYKDIDIAGFEKEQAEIRNKREARAKERINSLQEK